MIKLTEIKGKKIEYLIKGTGEKTVAIMHGMECSFYDWLDIVDEISQYARVIVINRPGVGHSELKSDGSSTEIASNDLYNLIKELNIEGKIILAGHSYGGLCVQHFARLYQEMIESILLVESSSIDAHKYSELDLPICNKTGSNEVYIELWTKYSKYTKEQLIEEIHPELSSKELNLPVEIQNELLELNVRPEIYANQLSELIDLIHNAKKIKTIGIFPNVPLKILVRDPAYSLNEMVEEGVPEIEAQRLEDLNQELADDFKNLSTMSELKVIKNSNHLMNETRPDAIIDSIKELLKAVK